MGRNSPSQFRREGRRDFEPHVDPEDICPYNFRPKTYYTESNKANWMEGWEEARKEYEDSHVACSGCGHMVSLDDTVHERCSACRDLDDEEKIIEVVAKLVGRTMTMETRIIAALVKRVGSQVKIPAEELYSVGGLTINHDDGYITLDV